MSQRTKKLSYGNKWYITLLPKKMIYNSLYYIVAYVLKRKVQINCTKWKQSGKVIREKRLSSAILENDWKFSLTKQLSTIWRIKIKLMHLCLFNVCREIDWNRLLSFFKKYI